MFAKFATLVLLLSSAVLNAQTGVPMQAFFEGTRILDVAIAPDGRHLAYIARTPDRMIVAVRDLNTPDSDKVVATNIAKERINPYWCGWANPSRLLCGYRGTVFNGRWYYPITRLVSVNVDGSDLKVLKLPTRERAVDEATYSQIQDEIIDWTPDDPNAVLIEMDGDWDGFYDVVALNVYTSERKVVLRQKPPMRSFKTDGNGSVRLAYGYLNNDTRLHFLARLNNEKTWRELSKLDKYSDDYNNPFRAVAIQPGSDVAYAFRREGDRDALWQLDLNDLSEPTVLFSHPTVAIDKALFTADRRLLGVTYETDKPAVYYTDARLRSLMVSINNTLQNTVNTIISMTPDQRILVIRAFSDLSPPMYYLLTSDPSGMKLEPIGAEYPGLSNQPLARMRPINYAAKDGTSIPGYLTIPAGMKEQAIPLVVMPHGALRGRDSWGSNRLVQFIASRGYAVLQMNFRGSDGYGEQWYASAHQNWSGLIYSDIADATRWAIKQGIADPGRICIVGAAYGGYEALLAATREGSTYRCAASISGVSDLPEALARKTYFNRGQIMHKPEGADLTSLAAESPRRHAENVSIPLLMIHGSADYTVSVEQTKLMASALKKADKPFKTVIIEGADHYYTEDADVKTLFMELEQFLGQHLSNPR